MLRVGGVAHARVDAGAMIEDAARVGERLEAPPAVIFAHARIPGPAERKFRDHGMDRAIVDGRVARPGGVQNAFGDAGVFGEHIQSKRRGPAVDPLDDRVDGGNLEHRQDWAEHLLFHDRRILGDVHEHGRRDITLGGVALAADDHFSAFHQPNKAIEVPRVDHPPIVRTRFRIVAEEVADRVLKASQERILHLGPDQHMVGGGTDLPRVEITPIGDSVRRCFQVRRGMHDRGILAAKLQDAWRQVFGRGLMDDLADLRAAREEDEVPFLLKQRAGFGDGAFDDRHGAGIKVFGRQFRRRRRTGRRKFGRLEHRGVAASQRRHERREKQHEGFVPRSDDQGHAVRIMSHANMARLEHKGRMNTFGRDPGVEMLERVVGLPDVIFDVHRVGVDDVAAQVFP